MPINWGEKPPATREDFRSVIEEVLKTSPVLDRQHLFQDLTPKEEELVRLYDELRAKSGNSIVRDLINQRILAGNDPTIGDILDICTQYAGPSIS